MTPTENSILGVVLSVVTVLALIDLLWGKSDKWIEIAYFLLYFIRVDIFRWLQYTFLRDWALAITSFWGTLITYIGFGVIFLLHLYQSDLRKKIHYSVYRLFHRKEKNSNDTNTIDPLALERISRLSRGEDEGGGASI